MIIIINNDKAVAGRKNSFYDNIVSTLFLRDKEVTVQT